MGAFTLRAQHEDNLGNEYDSAEEIRDLDGYADSPVCKIHSVYSPQSLL
jgi:hypothetical protein